MNIREIPRIAALRIPPISVLNCFGNWILRVAMAVGYNTYSKYRFSFQFSEVGTRPCLKEDERYSEYLWRGI